MATIAPHASFTFDQVAAEGPAARPLDFPAPRVRRGVRVNALVVHPTTGLRDILPGVIHRESYTNGGGDNGDDGSDHHDSTEDGGGNEKGGGGRGRERSSGGGEAESKEQSSQHRSKIRSSKSGSGNRGEEDHHDSNDKTSSKKDRKQSQSSSFKSQHKSSSRQDQDSRTSSASANHTSSSTKSSSRQEEYIAYFPQRRLQDAIYGSVWACLVLKRHYGPAADDAARAAGVRPGDRLAPIVWEIVGRHVAIKMIEWSKVHQSRGRLLEDPVKEIAAMQLIGTQHPNVLGSMEVLQDDDFLFSIMPYARGGDLFGYVVRDTELRGGEGGMSEPVARYWFRQLLDVSFVLKIGIGIVYDYWYYSTCCIWNTISMKFYFMHHSQCIPFIFHS